MSGAAKLAGTVEARIYVNLDCPAIARLVEAARRGERPVRATGAHTRFVPGPHLLRGGSPEELVALLAGSADGASVDLEPALATITDTVTWLIGAERRDESEPEEGAT